MVEFLSDCAIIFDKDKNERTALIFVIIFEHKFGPRVLLRPIYLRLLAEAPELLFCDSRPRIPSLQFGKDHEAILIKASNQS